MRTILVAAVVCAAAMVGAAQENSDFSVSREIDKRAESIEDKVIAWRRDIHQHPELGNREFKTAKKVAEHLKSLGLEVQIEVAHTGVVAVLRGGKPGPVVALRADMDALPVEEQTGLPYASKERGEYKGKDVGVMHACGHDNHVAILMGVAEVLASMKDQIPGTVKFIFQPAEEGTPDDEKGGAELMVAEGVMQDPAPEAVFGLHVGQQVAAGQVAYREGGAMASSDEFRITVKGRQTHAAMPWAGIDPIVVASQIVLGLQTIVSRQIESIAAPAIITVGTFNGGVRNNIIPETVELTGTIRSFLPKMQQEMHERVKRTAESIAASAGATAEVKILLGYPVTFNDPGLAKRMHGTLEGVFGAENVVESPMVTGAEDFSYYQQKAPGLFFFLGVRPPDVPIEKAIPNHSPLFYADESALMGGVKALAHLAVDYMEQGK